MFRVAVGVVGALAPSRHAVVGLALLAATVACSHEAEPKAPAPAAQAPNLGQLFELEHYAEVVAAAPEQLGAARQRGAPPAELWEIEHAFLLALAHTGPADRLIECWRADSVEFADVIPPDFLLQLHWHARATTSDDERTRLILATSEPFHARWLEYVSTLKDRGPYGNPEGFPRAWLAPDERPAELPAVRPDDH
jgi:hypothetical protein